jgi:hypothetical protein
MNELFVDELLYKRLKKPKKKWTVRNIDNDNILK